MRSRLPSLPPLKSASAQMPAHHFNRVRLAMARLGEPLQVVLPGMRGFEVHLDRLIWLCFDRSLNDAPILAWTDFRSARDGLGDPLPCRLVFYHAYADIIVRTVLDDIDRVLAVRLQRARRGQPQGSVVPFPRPAGQ